MIIPSYHATKMEFPFKSPTEIWTRVTGFRVRSASRYTIEPLLFWVHKYYNLNIIFTNDVYNYDAIFSKVEAFWNDILWKMNTLICSPCYIYKHASYSFNLMLLFPTMQNARSWFRTWVEGSSGIELRASILWQYQLTYYWHNTTIDTRQNFRTEVVVIDIIWYSYMGYWLIDNHFTLVL